MKLKHRFSDFRVTELLRPDLVQERGPHTLFRVTKKKLSTQDAVDALAEACGVEPGQVSVAGLKDRQGITSQHMSILGGKPVKFRSGELRVEPIGYLPEELTSADSRGNSFELTARAVSDHELSIFKKNIAPVREHGVPNYFDEQRFGNLRHGQGWIARDLMLGDAEQALRSFLCAPSPFDNAENHRFKTSVEREWGDWRACRDLAGRFGRHHSIFEYLGGHPGDFAGAFYHVASRLRLIHLYAYQSHVWNRALAERIRECVPAERRVRVEILEGPLVFFEGAPPEALLATRMPLPGAALEGVDDPADRADFERVLQAEGLSADTFRIDGVPGFQLKPEDRPALVVPRHLRVRPAVPDADHPGASAVVLRFELPRGAYATLVVKRLFARSKDARDRAEADRPRARREELEPQPRRQRAGGAGAWNRRGDEGERSRDRRGGGAWRSGGARDDRREGGGWSGARRSQGADHRGGRPTGGARGKGQEHGDRGRPWGEGRPSRREGDGARPTQERRPFQRSERDDDRRDRGKERTGESSGRENPWARAESTRRQASKRPDKGREADHDENRGEDQ